LRFSLPEIKKTGGDNPLVIPKQQVLRLNRS
jgi:hypothetical protein